MPEAPAGISVAREEMTHREAVRELRAMSLHPLLLIARRFVQVIRAETVHDVPYLAVPGEAPAIEEIAPSRHHARNPSVSGHAPRVKQRGEQDGRHPGRRTACDRRFVRIVQGPILPPRTVWRTSVGWMHLM